MSIKYKIALLFACLVTLLFALISTAVYFFSVNERDELFETRLKNRALSTARVYAALPDSNYSLLKRIDATPVASLYNKSITITGFNDTTVYSYSDNPADSFLLTKEVIEEVKINGEHNFVYNGKEAIAIHQQDSAVNFIVAVAALDNDGAEYFRQLKKILFISLAISILLSIVSGIVFARSLLKPVSQITSEVDLITSSNLTRRIVMKGKGDELTRLADTFNQLLDRLQESFSSQRLFISNASHELSTPLTSVSSQLDVTLQKKRPIEEYIEVLQSIREDIHQLQQLTRSLLDIAKAGSQGSIHLAEIRLDEVLFRVMADIQKQNSDYKVTLDFTTVPEDDKLLTTFGNSDLLYMALKNIIENGCKYASDNEAAVIVSFTQQAITTTVFNKGEVIPDADMKNIFQPFFRAESVIQKPGFGLGLTLSRQIISLHKGTVTAESNPGSGTSFVITLPNLFLFTRV